MLDYMTLKVSFTTFILWICDFFISVNFTRKSHLSHYPISQFGPLYLCQSSIFPISLQWHHSSEISLRSCSIVKVLLFFTDDQAAHLHYSFKSRVPCLVQSILLINEVGPSAIWTFKVLNFSHSYTYINTRCIYTNAHLFQPFIFIQ